MSIESKKYTKEIHEEIARKAEAYVKARPLVEELVRQALSQKINESEKSKRGDKKIEKELDSKNSELSKEERNKVHQLQDKLNDPALNKSAIGRDIKELNNYGDDGLRSIMSKIANGKYIPPTNIVNALLHTISGV